MNPLVTDILRAVENWKREILRQEKDLASWEQALLECITRWHLETGGVGHLPHPPKTPNIPFPVDEEESISQIPTKPSPPGGIQLDWRELDKLLNGDNND